MNQGFTVHNNKHDNSFKRRLHVLTTGIDNYNLPGSNLGHKSSYSEGQGDLVSRLMRGIARVTIWVGWGY